MPAARLARARGRRGLFEATATTGSSASISAWRFVPSPETRTPITPIDPPDDQVAARLRDDGAEADPEVEDAAQLVLLDVTREPVEDRRPLPGVPVDLGAQPVGDDAARGCPRCPPPVTCANACARPRSAADVVEVEPRRREQVVAVVVVLLEDPPDEREAVRVHAGGREADDAVAGLDAPSRRSARRARRRRRRCRRSRAPRRGRSPAARPSRRRSSAQPAARHTSAAPSTSSATCSRSMLVRRRRSRAGTAGRRRS